MGDGFEKFMKSMGVMCELWALTYSQFVKLGYSGTEAIEHTKGLMSSLISATMTGNGGKNEQV